MSPVDTDGALIIVKHKPTALLSQDQTLYSFRHTGAIRVFEKSGSLATLQRVLGHSDMKVSLTYLRGLEVKQLDIEDLPELNRRR